MGNNKNAGAYFTYHPLTRMGNNKTANRYLLIDLFIWVTNSCMDIRSVKLIYFMDLDILLDTSLSFSSWILISSNSMAKFFLTSEA